MPVAAPHINVGRLRGLGVAAKTRSAVVPNVRRWKSRRAGPPRSAMGTACSRRRRRRRPCRTSCIGNGVAVKSPEVRAAHPRRGRRTRRQLHRRNSPAFYKAEAVKWADVAKQSGHESRLRACLNNIRAMRCGQNGMAVRSGVQPISRILANDGTTQTPVLAATRRTGNLGAFRCRNPLQYSRYCCRLASRTASHIASVGTRGYY